ncbi:MAG: flagellar hook-length control protein FliK [Sideroxydans sp.]|nr:flagellar hook-length control protein FliK [Sideroxydans sp.]
MSTLPLIPSASSSNVKASAANNNSNKSEATSPDTPPFGTVLARQVNSNNKENDDKGTNAASSTEKTDSSVAQDDSSNTSLPTDLLASLIPQTAASATPPIAPQALPTPQPASSAVTTPLVTDAAGMQTNKTLVGIEAGLASTLQKTASSATTSTDKPLLTSSSPVETSDTPTLITTDPKAATVTAKETFASLINRAQVEAAATKVSDQATSEKSTLIPQAAVNTSSTTLVQSMPNLNPAVTSATQLVVNTPISHNRWAEDVGQKITWLAGQQDQHAELHLNPPQLGPLDVVLKVTGDQATVQFTSAHAMVREAIEQSIPKLREMLADNGIMLGNTTVSDQTPRDQRGESGAQSRSSSNENTPALASNTVVTSQSVLPLRNRGMVDTFA